MLSLTPNLNINSFLNEINLWFVFCLETLKKSGKNKNTAITNFKLIRKFPLILTKKILTNLWICPLLSQSQKYTKTKYRAKLQLYVKTTKRKLFKKNYFCENKHSMPILVFSFCHPVETLAIFNLVFSLSLL